MIAIYLAALDTDDDRARFLKIYDEHNRKVFFTARSVLKTQQRAEDAAQEVWTKVVQDFDRIMIVPVEKLGAYLITMARNFSINMLKKESRTAEMPDDWDESRWLDSSADDGESDRKYNSLVDLIMEMPENYRQILELKYVLEWKNRDIATFVGMKQSSVESRIARGSELLLLSLHFCKNTQLLFAYTACLVLSYSW